MKPSTQDACNHLIISLPEELQSEDWEKLQLLVPADVFLQGVFDWLFTNQQEALNDLLEIVVEQAVEHRDGVKFSDEAEHLIRKVAAVFYDEFSDMLSDLIPETFHSPKYVKNVIYDEDGNHIYISFDAEGLEDIPIVISSTELIDQENEDDDDDSDDESEEETEEDDGVEED